jgi:hypothetical protein
MSEDELRAELTSPAAERRFVAAFAVGDRRLMWAGELVERLTDSSPPVRQAARRSLVILSFLALNPDEAAAGGRLTPAKAGRAAKCTPPVDFGPAPAADKAGRAAAARKWTEWWASQRGPRTLKTDNPTDPGAGVAAAQPSEAERLAAEFTRADPGRRKGLLTEYRDRKGGEYTRALAAAIGHLSGDERREARTALAERLARMTVATLGGYLCDEDPEVRRAALLALAMRESTAHVPRMIELLRDPEPSVERAAHAALKSLSGLELGPRLSPTEAEREQAVAEWKDWWRRKGNPFKD